MSLSPTGNPTASAGLLGATGSTGSTGATGAAGVVTELAIAGGYSVVGHMPPAGSSALPVQQLLPAGHAPGLFLIVGTAAVRVAASGGTVAHTAYYTASGVPMNTASSGAAITSVRGIGLAQFSTALASDGSSPVTLHVLFTSVTGAPVIDFHAHVLRVKDL